MSDLLTIPMQDDYQTTLSSTWAWWTGTVNITTAPAGTIPAGKYSYIVVNPWEANMQVAKIDGWAAGTVNVTSITVPKSQAVNYSAVSHASGAVVRFSNNLAFWIDIQTAISTKVNTDDDSTISNTKKIQFWNTTSYIKTDDTWTNLKFKDGSNVELTLSQIASWGWADQKVAITTNDTTTATLDTKLTAGDGIKKTVINPAGNESLDLDIDVTDTTIFVKTSSGAGDENKIPVLDSNWKLANGFINWFTSDITNLIRDRWAATAIVTYSHTLWRTPSIIQINWYCSDARSNWYSYGATKYCLYSTSAAAWIVNSTSYSINVSDWSNGQTGIIQNLTSTTFDIARTKVWASWATDINCIVNLS